MNDFTKEELKELANGLSWIIDRGQQYDITYHAFVKLKSMIDNYCEHEVIGTGQLLFHDKHSSSGVLPEINKQLSLCENDEESKCFRVDWKIIYGKKFGY